MNVPDGMRVLFQGKADFMREVAEVLRTDGIRTVSGPLPSK